MKRIALGLILGLLLIATNALAADGDLIVNGKVGVGTTSPQAKIDIFGGSTNNLLQMGQGSYGNWRFRYSGYNLIIENDYHNGASQPPAFDPRVTIDYGGNVGIGTTNPSAPLTIQANASTADAIIMLGRAIGGNPSTVWFKDSTGSFAKAWIQGDDNGLGFNAGGGGYQVLLTPSGNVGIGTTNPSGYKLYVNGSMIAASYATSDIRFKKNITPLEDPLARTLQLQGVNYEWRVDEFKDRNFEEGRQIGLIAQDVEQVFPELVKTDAQGYKAVSYEKLTAVLVEAIKEQQKKITELEEKIKTLERGK